MNGQDLSVIQVGQHNAHGGPDFLNARLKIGGEIWSGHVEIHIRSSDWNRHGHSADSHYKNVILHAVFENDVEIFHLQKGDLPVFDFSQYMIDDQWQRYQQWLKSKTWIPCEAMIKDVDQLTWVAWKDRLLLERLEEKSIAFMGQFEKTGGNWSEVFYRKLARGFGFKHNADAMETMAESLPQSTLARHKSDPFQIEALLFGYAGFLQEIFTDEYPASLQKEFLFLNLKYQFKAVEQLQWNFGRLRPSNFPTIRLAQFSALICKSEHLWSILLESNSVIDHIKLFEVEAHEYWNFHYRFDAASPNSVKENYSKRLGKDAVQNILINTVAVMLFTYGKHNGDQKQIDKAIELLEYCSAENNSVLANWESLNVKCNHSADSQSLLQLYNVYCTTRRCLHCQVGLKMLKNLQSSS